jgi:hypothetical protein
LRVYESLNARVIRHSLRSILSRWQYWWHSERNRAAPIRHRGKPPSG